MAKPIMRAFGSNGQIHLLPDRVVITREGWLNAISYGFNSRREIPIGAISEIAFKPATALQLGEIEFMRSGRSSSEGKEGRKAARHSKVKFIKKQTPHFEALKEKVFELIEKNSRQRQP